MINKNDQRDPIDNLAYEKILEEEILNSYQSKFQRDIEEDCKKNILTNLYFINKTILRYFQNHDLFV